MSAAAPWSVKGIEPRAREIAKDLARRSGMTLGEWLNTMIMEDGDDEDGVVPLSRRPHAADSYERRSRSRRVDDAYGAGDEPWQRLGASIDAIAARLEAAERRSTVAIQGVDQAVSGLVRRLDTQDEAGRGYGRRIDEIAEDLRDGHRRLRKFEQEVGPKTTETFGKVESTLGALAGRLYDIEERQRGGVNELRQRMDAVEKTAGPGVGSELIAQVGQRLDEAQNRTTDALRGLERSFADLDQRLRAAEARGEPEGSREAARFEKLAETLSRQVEANRAEMMRRMDSAENEGRMDRLERALLAIGDHAKASEERSAKAVETMGREVLRIAENLNGRIGKVEADGAAGVEKLGEALTRKVESDMGRFAHGLEQRLVAADDRHAMALEKLGGEITRISDRLSERIAQSERRSQQALEDIGRRLADSSNKIEQHYDRASGELAERMRLSEERTAALIAEARENIGRRAAPEAAETVQPDWRAAAFPETAFPEPPFADGFEDPVFAEQQAWSADLAPPEPESRTRTDRDVLTADSVFDAVMRGPDASPAAAPTAPFGSRAPDPSPIDPSPAEAAVPAPQAAAEPARPAPAPVQVPFGQGFGGADVSDALAATAGQPLDPGQDDFAAETDFVDPRALRAAAAQGRASSTRQAIDAARAAMATPEEPQPRSGFGLKRGGKSKLQERLDKQAAKGGETVRKALGASAVAVLLTAGGAAAFGELTGTGFDVRALIDGEQAAQPVVALAAAPREASLADRVEGAERYREAIGLLDAADPAGAATLKQAAELGYPVAMTKLAEVYETGGPGVEPDPVQARQWLRRAAEAGEPMGMHNYGLSLYEGAGEAPADQAAGLSWLLRAALAGLTDSQFNVARVYEQGGEGILADPAEAYKWYLIAARAGDAEAQEAAERLRAGLPAAARNKARAEADRFTAAPPA